MVSEGRECPEAQQAGAREDINLSLRLPLISSKWLPSDETNRLQRAREPPGSTVLRIQPPGRGGGPGSLERSWRGKWRKPAHSPHITLPLHFPEVLGSPSRFSPPVLMLSVSLLSSVSSLSVPSHRAIGTKGLLHLPAAAPPTRSAQLHFSIQWARSSSVTLSPSPAGALPAVSQLPSGTGNLSGTNILKSRFEVANLSLIYPFT